MTDKSTWVKLYRDITQWCWYKDGNTMRVFIHLIVKANIKTHDFMGVTIHRGEVATSYNSIAQDLALTRDQIRTTIEHLKSTGEITVRIYPKFQVISIENYDRYQSASHGKAHQNPTVKPSRSPPKSHQSNNVKNGKNNIALTRQNRDWEETRAVPDRYRGRFPDEHAWLEFIGEVDPNEI